MPEVEAADVAAAAAASRSFSPCFLLLLQPAAATACYDYCDWTAAAIVLFTLLLPSPLLFCLLFADATTKMFLSLLPAIACTLVLCTLRTSQLFGLSPRYVCFIFFVFYATPPVSPAG